MDAVTRSGLRDRFDHAAATYATARPGYPDAAAAWLLDGRRGDVLDLGAGSGALTRQLAPYAETVVAADPGHHLLCELRASNPGVPAVRTGAELLPFAGRTFDTVTVATAFHWFDPERALPEIARVLRAGGHLGLVWNMRSVEEPWSRGLDRLMRSAQPAGLQGSWGAGSVRALDTSPLFEEPAYAQFAHRQRLDRAGLVALVGTRSYVIALDPPARQSLLAEIGALFDAHAGPDGVLELPYVAQCWRSAVRPPGLV